MHLLIRPPGRGLRGSAEPSTQRSRPSGHKNSVALLTRCRPGSPSIDVSIFHCIVSVV